MNFEPACLPTIIGSLPHTDARKAVELILKYTPELPAWPQLPKRPCESMMRQFTDGIPGFVEREGKTYFDTSIPDFEDELLAFYEKYIAASEGEDSQALEEFRTSQRCAAGLYELLNIPHFQDAVAVKGQITGPFTLGTTLTDQDRRSAYYDSRLRETIVKSLAMKTKWQIRQLHRYELPVIIFIDEPGMRYFGAADFVGISREDIIQDLGEMIDTIHSEGCIAGIHCCGNTDWSVILDTKIDILSFDAYEYFDRIVLYADGLKKFLDRGGVISWGIIPTLQVDKLPTETTDSLVSKFEEYVKKLEKRGLTGDHILRQSIITPSCGMRGLSEEMAVYALQLTSDVSRRVSQKLRSE